jgi:thioester reductase-like protein
VRASSQAEASARVVATLVRWNLWHEDFDGRIIAIPGDLRLPRLGMDEDMYRFVSQSVDSIYHCGTSMNHLETFAMARPANVEGAVEILRLAIRDKPKLINYVSTLGIFTPLANCAERSVNEASPIDHERHLSSSGYVASKWVGEKIIMTAMERRIPCNIFRLGLVWADSEQGRYDELQRDYRILKSSLLAGVGIQNYQPLMPPTPVDFVARAIVSLANRYPNGEGTFHISSTSPIAEGLFERCNAVAGTSLELVPFYDWVCEVKRLHYAGQSLPAVPLVEFAFSMDEATLCAYQHRIEYSGLHIDSSCTLGQLERAGVAAPMTTNELVRVSVENMLSTDSDLREVSEQRLTQLLAHAGAGMGHHAAARVPNVTTRLQ